MAIIEYGRRRRRRRGGGMAGIAGMGDMAGGRFEALVVGTPAGVPMAELWREGMAGMGAAPSKPTGLDALTGGALGRISSQLDRATAGLKFSIAASAFAGGAALLLLLSQPRRRRI